MIAHGQFRINLRSGFFSLCILLLLTSGSVRAVTPPSYFFLGSDQFAGVDIYDIIQDKNFNYWIATEDGLYRYDNYEYTRVSCFGMKGTAVFGFTEGKGGRIYCHNLNQQIFQISNSQCTLLYELGKDEISSDLYMELTVDSSLLVACRKPFRIDPETGKKKTQFSIRGYCGFPFRCSDGSIIIHMGSSDTLVRYANERFSYEQFHTQGPLTGVLKFIRFQNEILAVNVNTNVFYHFDEHLKTLTEHTNQPFASMSEYFRYYVVQNRLWIAGTHNGVFILPELTPSASPYYQFDDRIISDVFADREGNILLSTFGTGILVIPDINVEGTISVPGNSAVMSVQFDSKMGLIAGTADGHLYSYLDHSFTALNNAASRPLQSVFTWEECPFILIDDGEFSNGGNLKVIDKENRQSRAIGRGSLKDAAFIRAGVIYCALNTGLCELNWTNSSDAHLTSVPDFKVRCHSIAYADHAAFTGIATSDGLTLLSTDGKVTPVMYNGQPVFTTCVGSSADYMYAGSVSNLLLKVNAKGEVDAITLEGFEDEVFTKIAVKDDKLYVLGSTSLFVYDAKGKLLQKINPSGVSSHESINDFCLSGNEIWAGHNTGLQRFVLSDKSSKSVAPLLWFSLITVGNDTLDASTSGEFDGDDRKFRFVLSSPTLRNTAVIQYHYQLEGNDTSWTVAPYAEHELIYQSLAPGNYTLLVKAENNGIFSNTIQYSFVVRGPFWNSVWFYGGITLLLALIITIVYRYRLRTQERKSRLINELLASRLTAIQSQMNPHFIFNSLNSIQDLVLKGDVDNSYTFITKFSNLVRRTLSYSDKDFIEFSQEIKLLELYLSLEKLRFKDDLEFAIRTDGIDDILIPPMLIQPFIENSLLHGLLHKEGKKKLFVSFELTEHLICTIEDNGIGREKSKEIKSRQRADHESFSSEAIRKRFSILSRLFEGDLGYVYEDLSEDGKATGTRVILTIPVKRNF